MKEIPMDYSYRCPFCKMSAGLMLGSDGRVYMDLHCATRIGENCHGSYQPAEKA